MSEVEVVLAAAEPMLRLGMRSACEAAGIGVAGEVADRVALCAMADALASPSVIVAESTVLQPDCRTAVRELATRHRILVVEHGCLDQPQLLRAGASGFLSRAFDARALCRAVTIAHSGGLVLTDRPLADADPAGSAVHLTSRERDVLRLIADGDSTQSAAHTLHIGATTAKTHVRNACTKLGARSRSAAVAKATSMGLLE